MVDNRIASPGVIRSTAKGVGRAGRTNDQGLPRDELPEDCRRRRACVGEHGFVVTGGNGRPTAYPLLASIRAHREAIAKLIARLGYEPDPRIAGT